MDKTLKEQFHEKYISTPAGCWMWTGSLKPAGYGTMWLNEKNIHAHRLSWQLHNGTIPDGLFVLHKCDVPGCVNPEHLFLGTQKDNIADCAKKNRSNKSLLTWDDVRNIRAKLSQGVLQYVLAEEYNVHRTTIYHIRKRKTWRE
ncbi:hypothetical protein LCGC14_1509500 [marine sediment metagenome]|uniref:HNH nuclease domain-containing protein n=1 Tax=marine sediment metagenome TaxID=412755 RepID=A0A0F9J1V4_9ZZZZ